MQIEISTLTPDEDSETVYGASLEEEEEEDELDKEHGNKNELPIRPSLIPSGSGVPEVLIGSHTPGGLYYTNSVPTHTQTHTQYCLTRTYQYKKCLISI